MAEQKRTFRVGLAALFTVSLLVCSLAFGGQVGYAVADAKAASGQIDFTPHVTPLAATSFPAPTLFPPIVPPRATPLPVAPSTPGRPGALEAFDRAIGGDQTSGYAPILGSDPPMWKVWFGDEVLYIRTADPAASVLLASFELAVHSQADALADMQSADRTRNEEWKSVARGGAEIFLGGIVAAASCSGVPLTFWAMGGSGWICAASVGVVGLGIWEVGSASAEQGYQSREYLRAAENAASEADQARIYFEALRLYAEP